MAINNHTTTSNSPLARTDAPNVTAPQQIAPEIQPPRLHAVASSPAAPGFSSGPASIVVASPLTATRPPQLQAGSTPDSPRCEHAGDGVTAPIPASGAAPSATVEALLEAVRGNDVHALTSLLIALEQSGKDVAAEINCSGEMDVPSLETEDSTEVTALMAAACYGHREMIELLLAAGADVAPHTRESYSPLMFAALNGHADTVQALLQAGAEVDQADEDGSTALMYAAQEGHTAAL